MLFFLELRDKAPARFPEDYVLLWGGIQVLLGQAAQTCNG